MNLTHGWVDPFLTHHWDENNPELELLVHEHLPKISVWAAIFIMTVSYCVPLFVSQNTILRKKALWKKIG